MQLRCPEHGLLSLRCAHPELAQPIIGIAMMMIGGFLAGIGLLEKLGVLR